jgi:hypothetical protein
MACDVVANRIDADEFGRAFLLLVAGIDFLSVETGKADASDRFRRNGIGGALESACGPRETEIP